MTITTLKSEIAAYLQQSPTDYLVNGVDLLLNAINRSHQYAQQQYDFQFARCTVDALVSLTNGSPMSPLPLHGTSNLVTVKKITRSYVNDNFGGYRPLLFWDRDTQGADADQRWAGIPYPFAPVQRDMPSYPNFNMAYLVQFGRTLLIYPNAQVVIRQDPLPVFLDVYRYFPDYKDDSLDNVDFLLEFGSDFLLWNSICRLNVRSKEFVPRQEGNIPVPTDERDKAWQDLLAWDAQMIVTGTDAYSLD